MSKNKMISKLSNSIVDQTDTQTSHDYQWTSKSYKNMFIQKLGNYAIVLLRGVYASTRLVA
jgi:hypothetical protein